MMRMSGSESEHISVGYAVCVVVCALFLGAAFSYGGALGANGVLSDPTATLVTFCLLTVVFAVVLFAICELLAVANAGKRARAERVGAETERAERVVAETALAERASDGQGAARTRAERIAAERSTARRTPARKAPTARVASSMPLEWLTPCLAAKSITVFSLVMCVFWIPYMVALFPGSMNWDTFYQISMYQGTFPVYVIPWIDTHSIVDAWLSDHHPVFDTLIYGFFAKTSLDLTGTWHAGVFAFCLIQCVLTAAVFTGAVAYLRRIGAPLGLCLGIYLFFCLMPFYPMYGMTMLKDSTHALVFVPYLVLLTEIVRTRGQALSRRGVCVWFVVLGLLLALTKKTGLVVVVITAVVLAFALRKHWKPFAVQAGASALVMLVLFPYVLFPVLNIIPGGVQEPLNLLFQQTARYVTYCPNDVTDTQREAINAVLPYDSLAKEYVFNDSDTVKAWYRYDTATTQDLMTYVGVWAQMGLAHPDVYFQQVAATASPFFNAHGVMGVHGQSGDGVAKEAEPPG